MLLLRALCDQSVSGRSHVAVLDAGNDGRANLLMSCWAEGIPHDLSVELTSRTFTRHRLIIDPSFNPLDIIHLGRYGFLEFSEEPSTNDVLADWRDRFYITGGKQASCNQDLVGLLRLSDRDHRDLTLYVKHYEAVICETGILVADSDVSFRDEEVVQSDPTPVLRLRGYLSKAALVSSPFLIPFVAGAQCVSPSSGNYDSGTNYSGVDFNHIINSDEGGNATTGYIPDSKSGVTIAGGLDLGVHTASDLTAMGVPSNLISQFTPFLATGSGSYTTGAAAQAALKANPSAATITVDQANQINNAVYPYYSTAVATAFNNASATMNFSDLNVQRQTVIVSMYYQAQSITGTQFWTQVTSGDWSDALANLADFDGPSSSQNDRAKKNADYLNSTGCTNGTDNGG